MQRLVLVSGLTLAFDRLTHIGILFKDDCTNFRDCTNCTTIQSCGWCGGSLLDSFCTFGDASGPSINATCDWYYDDCPCNDSTLETLFYHQITNPLL